MSKKLRCGLHYKVIVDDNFYLLPGQKLAITGRDYKIGKGYAAIYKWEKGRNVLSLLHRHILGLTKGDGVIVDHINFNRLDNRIENLRRCSPLENQWHRLSKSVSHDKRTNRYCSRVSVNDKPVHLGSFKNERDAIICSNNYKRQTYGEFAVLWPIE